MNKGLVHFVPALSVFKMKAYRYVLWHREAFGI